MSNASLRINTVSVNVIALAGIAKAEYLSQKCTQYADKVDSIISTLTSLNVRRESLITSLTSLKFNMETELAILKTKAISASHSISAVDQRIGSMKRHMGELASDDQSIRLTLASDTMKATAQRNIWLGEKRALDSALQDLTAEIMRVDATIRVQISASTSENECINTIGTAVSQLWYFKDLTFQRTELFRIMSRYASAFASNDASSIMTMFGLSQSLSRLNLNLKSELLNNPDGFDGTAVYDFGVEGTDIYQGGIGDCWLIAMLSGIAGQDNEAIKDIITVTGHNEYKVKLYDANGKRFTVNVNADEYAKLEEVNDGSTSSRAYEEWVAILEVAISKSPQIFKEGANEKAPGNITGGNSYASESVYSAITGGSASTAPVTSKKYSDGRSQTFSNINAGLRNGGVVAISTPVLPEGAPDAIVGNHVFTVINTFTENGTEFVTVRNPWGAGNGTSDGFFTVDIDTVNNYFDNVYVGKS